MKSRLFRKILLAFWLTFFCLIPAIWVPIAFLSGETMTPLERLGPVLSSQPYEQPPLIRDFNLDRFWAGSWQLLLVGGLSGIAFSILVARYLIRPVQILHRGFDCLERGDFEIRLAPKLGNRRDEIADLALAFDATAQRLDSLVNARDRLLHDVSHELRSPLSRLQLAVGLLRQNPGRQNELLDRFEREIGRVSHMISEILALARAEGQSAQEETYYDPTAIVAGLVSDAEFEARSSAVAIKLSIAEKARSPMVAIEGSEELFTRAIENVLRNAIRHSPAHSTVSADVEVTTADPIEWAIVIKDQGPGISAASIGTIFSPFSRGSDGDSPPGGYGLGLSIAHRAVMAQRGSIVAQNDTSGGLSVEISFPCLPMTFE